MTASHLESLLPRLRGQDLREILGASRHETLQSWAAAKVASAGVSLTVLVDGVPMICGGVLEGAVRGIGVLWMVGARGCERHIKHVLRVWRVILKEGGFRRLECKCYAGNEKANEFARRAGLRFEGGLTGYALDGSTLNQYGLTGGQHGR